MLWVQASLLKLRSNLFFGVLEPVLRALHRRALTAEEIKARLIEAGRPSLGAAWKGAGCFRNGDAKVVEWSPPRLEVTDSAQWIETNITLSDCDISAPPHLAGRRYGESKSNESEKSEQRGSKRGPESLCLSADDGEGTTPIDLLRHFGADALEKAIQSALPNAPANCVMSMYADTKGADHALVLQVLVKIETIGFLHELRDDVLGGRLEVNMMRKLAKERPTLRLVADRSAFARIYESTILKLDQLTSHQEEKHYGLYGSLFWK